MDVQFSSVAMIVLAGQHSERVEYSAYDQAFHRWGDGVREHYLTGEDHVATDLHDFREVSSSDGCLINGFAIDGRLSNAEMEVKRDWVIDKADVQYHLYDAQYSVVGRVLDDGDAVPRVVEWVMNLVCGGPTACLWLFED